MLRIDYADYEALRAHGEETYPYECCGVLLGKSEPGTGNLVRALVRAGNTESRGEQLAEEIAGNPRDRAQNKDLETAGQPVPTGPAGR